MNKPADALKVDSTPRRQFRSAAVGRSKITWQSDITWHCLNKLTSLQVTGLHLRLHLAMAFALKTIDTDCYEGLGSELHKSLTCFASHQMHAAPTQPLWSGLELGLIMIINTMANVVNSVSRMERSPCLQPARAACS